MSGLSANAPIKIRFPSSRRLVPSPVGQGPLRRCIPNCGRFKRSRIGALLPLSATHCRRHRDARSIPARTASSITSRRHLNETVPIRCRRETSPGAATVQAQQIPWPNQMNSHYTTCTGCHDVAQAVSLKSRESSRLFFFLSFFLLERIATRTPSARLHPVDARR